MRAWQLLDSPIYLWLFAMRVYTVDVEFDEFNPTAVRNRCQLDDCVKWNLQVRQFIRRLIEEVSENATKYCLMRHDENIALSLQLHHNRLQTNNHVFIGLSTWISKRELIRISILEVVRKFSFDLLVRHLFTNALHSWDKLVELSRLSRF